MLIVKIAIFVSRIFFVTYEIVIGRDDEWRYAIVREVVCEALGKGCFTGR